MKLAQLLRWLLAATLVAAAAVPLACDEGGDGDADSDADGDVDGDADGDADADGSTDASADADASSGCVAAGGTCTGARWELCPVGTEPIDPDPHRDCTAEMDGWCCVAAPDSPCTATAGVNCIVGTACTGCWAPPDGAHLDCEAGRVCCTDVCD